MSRFNFRDNVWSKWFPRFYHDHDTYRSEKLPGILERFVKICSEYFDDIMVDHPMGSVTRDDYQQMEPGLDNIIELLDPDTTPELFMNYLWEFLGEIPYGYGLVVQNKEYNKDDITDWLRSDTYFRANSRKLLKYAISLYKIRGTQRFYQILGKFYYVQFTLIETENGGSPGDPLPLPTYDHLVIATFTQIDTQENVSYYPRGNGIQVRAGYPDGDCYSCLYYALKITVPSEEYNNWVSAGKVDVVKNTLVQIVERYLPVHCKLARYADNSLMVILEVDGLPIETYTFAWSDYVCVQSEVRVLTGITSTFTQGSAIIYDTDNINDLKQYLTIIAEYSDGTSRELTNSEYILTGTLTAPSSTITVTFESQTDTFTVQVTSSVVNLWNMASPQMTTSDPGYNAASKTIDADGTITYTNRSGSSAARIQLSMPASEMGLVNGKQYTVKVWILNNELSSNMTNIIMHAGGSSGSGASAYTTVRPPSPISITFTQADDLRIAVGALYAQNYAVGDIYSIRVMVAEGDHIDDFVPFDNQN